MQYVILFRLSGLESKQCFSSNNGWFGQRFPIFSLIQVRYLGGPYSGGVSLPEGPL